jgi:hypothetical protein
MLSTVFMVLTIVFIVLTSLTLGLGVAFMGKDNSNTLMRFRVVLQALALLSFVGWMYVK